MSIADVSKTMSDLAAAINKKNTELEALKEEYTKSLYAVQQYLKQVQNSDVPQSRAEFLAMIETPVSCSACGHTIYGTADSADYVLVPKKALEVGEEPKKETARNCLENTPMGKSHGRSSKRTCSYCGKAGHSRARCFARLSKEPTSNS